MIVSVEVQKLQKIIKDIEKILPAEEKKYKSFSSKSVKREYELTEIEKEIDEYIRNNPGTSKQKIVD